MYFLANDMFSYHNNMAISSRYLCIKMVGKDQPFVNLQKQQLTKYFSIMHRNIVTNLIKIGQNRYWFSYSVCMNLWFKASIILFAQTLCIIVLKFDVQISMFMMSSSFLGKLKYTNNISSVFTYYLLLNICHSTRSVDSCANQK